MFKEVAENDYDEEVNECWKVPSEINRYEKDNILNKITLLGLTTDWMIQEKKAAN